MPDAIDGLTNCVRDPWGRSERIHVGAEIEDISPIPVSLTGDPEDVPSVYDVHASVTPNTISSISAEQAYSKTLAD